MFTRATRDFGIWREHHPSRRRCAGRPSSNFVFSLAVAAFVSWMIFVILFRMRSEFFRIESLFVPLNGVKTQSAELLPNRAAAISLALVNDRGGSGDVRLVFGDGNSFLLSREQEKLREYLSGLMDNIEYQVMLSMRLSPTVTRVQIWPEAGIDAGALRRALALFSAFGFDDFDIAVQPGKKTDE